MICNGCSKELERKDFLLDQILCFRCTYKLKLECQKNKEKHKCKACGIRFERDKNIKKRQRNVFCSKECAFKGHKEQINNHWTRVVRDNSLDFI